MLHLSTIGQYVKEHGTYVERDHPTIGSFWTVDKWVLKVGDNDLVYRLEDEGWTSRVFYKTLEVSQGGDKPIHVVKGNIEDLNELEQLAEQWKS